MQDRLSSPDPILAQKERFYKRNFFTYMLDGFFYSFAAAMFSTNSVLPAFVSALSDNKLLISLLSVFYYGLIYSASIVACFLGVNAKSPKRICVAVCLTQRFGLLCIFLSTLFIGRSSSAACLVLFFAAFCIYTISEGLTTPLFTQMVSTTIHRDLGKFYGSYSLIGSASGVLASALLTRLFGLPYPGNFRLMFLLGVIFAVCSSLSLAFGIKEVPDGWVPEQVRARELPSLFREALVGNRKFRHFTVIYVILGAAEFAVPFYIVRLCTLDGLPDGYIGIMSTLYLLANMAGAKIHGAIADKKGALFMLRFACACGAAAALLAALLPGYWWGFPTYALLAFASTGVYLSGDIACTTYSGGKHTPVYTAACRLCAAPVYIAASLASGVIANRFSMTFVFLLALAAYLTGAVLTFLFDKKNTAE